MYRIPEKDLVDTSDSKSIPLGSPLPDTNLAVVEISEGSMHNTELTVKGMENYGLGVKIEYVYSLAKPWEAK